MGRHRKTFAGERLQASITTQLTPSDRAALDRVAAELDMSPTLFSRSAILNAIRSAEASMAQRKAERERDTTLAGRITRLGTGFNLLAKAANETRQIANEFVIEDICRQLVSVLGEISPLARGVPEPMERKQLLMEVKRVGTNVQQLERIAQKTRSARAAAGLRSLHLKIIDAFDLVTPA